MRFEIEVELDAKMYEYVDRFRIPERSSKKLRVLEETHGRRRARITRKQAHVHLAERARSRRPDFQIDWGCTW